MREVTEVVVELEWDLDGQNWADQIENIAERMAAKGWFYLECRPDHMLQTITLFFERDVREG